MVQGEPLGAAVVADLPQAHRAWAGPWQAGVRPGQGWRVGVPTRVTFAEAMGAEATGGSKIR